METTTPPQGGASLRKWLLRIFLASFLMAIAVPVVLAFMLLHMSSDTRALRNAALAGDSAKWKRIVEVSAGMAPVGLAKMILPFTPAPAEARQALSALRSAEVSVYEIRHGHVDRADVLRRADEEMRLRGWERTVGVLERDTAVAVYVRSEGGDKIKVSVLVLDHKHMVAVSGRGALQPLFELAMDKANEGPFKRKFHFSDTKIVARTD